MRILLVRPCPHKDTIGLQSVMVCEPLELMELAAVLQAGGHKVFLADMILEKRKLEDFIHHYRPHLVGITGYISHIGVMKSYAKRIKQESPGTVVAVGGVHATVCPGDFKSRYIDRIFRSASEFYQYAGCEAQAEGTLPDRTITARYADRYYYLFQNHCALIKTSYGCPYNCNFCFCKEITPYKARPIDRVIDELLTIPQQEVYIVDDDFLFNPGRLLEFCKKVKAHQIRKHYLVYGRADFIAANEDVIKELKSVGLSAVIVGIEAASQKELDQYNKKTRLDDNKRAVEILKKYDVECYATVILGIDWEKQQFDQLYQFIKSCGLVFVNLQPFTPMPGTPYFAQEEKNLLIPYQQYEKWDMAHLVVKPKNLSVRAYYYQIIRLYYRITITPANVLYMFRKYGVGTTMKLSAGAMRITLQYIKKMIEG